MVSPTLPASALPHIVDSRRLLGPNLYSVRCGAVLEVACDEADRASLTAAWALHADALVRALAWGEPELHTRMHPGGATLFLAAPVDVLLTATEVNEQAWTLAESHALPNSRGTATTVLRTLADTERRTHPNLAATVLRACALGASATFDDEWLTVGSGSGSQSWAMGAVPDPADIAWQAVRDIPIALVTGSNGKTTTTRLLVAMWRAAGVTPGWSCSDGVFAGEVQLESGDFSGPTGARTVLRQAGVDAAVLETARGGILRRGLAVTRADAAIITNISADHFGEYGISTLRELADVKAVVARALHASGRLVLNADDPLLIELGARHTGSVAWFSASMHHAAVDAHVDAGGDAALLRDGHALLRRGEKWHDLGDVRTMPITLGGAAPHNVENLLGAALVAGVLGVPIDAIQSVLATFGASASDNPGRLQVYRYGAMTVLVDYAHNPEGLAALCQTAMATEAGRRLLLLGQAGNRDDEQLRALVRAAMDVVPFDRVIIKEELTLLRGREPGDVPRVLADELRRIGVPADRIEVAPSELVAMQRAFAWARDGDLLVCPIHAEKVEVLGWLSRLSSAEWRVGLPLPQ